MRTADLHLHTDFSDGTEPPERVVALAKAAGLSAISITDHDTMEGLPLAEPAACREGLELIPGIEMSASAEGLEVHILGYYLDAAHPVLTRHLAEQKARRIGRIHEMVRRLQRVGVTIDAEEVLRLAGRGTVGRPHVARVLLNHGYVATTAEAFSRYIGPDNPGFVPGSPLAPAQIIDVIRQAGGIPVLAHPVFLKRDPLIDRFAEEGLAGLEVYHSSHTPEQVQQYEALAERLSLLRTGGSDFHGDAKEGLPVGSVLLPYIYVVRLKAWKAPAAPSA